MRGGLLTSFAWTFAGKLGQQGSAFVVGALLTRALGTAGRGFFAEAQTWIGMAIALLGFGLDASIYHFANRERYPVSDGVRLALTATASLAVALLASSAMVASGLILPDLISREAAHELPLMFAAAFATLVATNLVTLAQALGHVRLAALSSALQGAVNLAIVCALFAAQAIDLRAALVAVLLTQGAGAVVAAIGLAKLDRPTFDGLTRTLAWSFVSAGLKQHIGVVAVFIYLRFNTLLVLRYSGADQTGLLATAWTLAFGIFGMVGSFQLALYPRVLNSSDDFEITVRSLRLALYLGSLFVAPLVFAAPWLLRYYGGASFEAATPTFRVLVVAAWIMFLCSVAAPYVIKSGALLVASGGAILVGCASIGANYLLVPRLHAVGAGLATLIAVVLNLALSVGLVAFISRRSPMGFVLPYFGAEWSVVRRRFGAGQVLTVRPSEP